jgi:hypothetical protein
MKLRELIENLLDVEETEGEQTVAIREPGSTNTWDIEDVVVFGDEVQIICK